jgi:adenylate cyclase
MMHYVNDRLMGYFVEKLGRAPIKFRVGIDTGPITIARVAIPGGSHGSVVAVGTSANVACKLMKLIPDGGICIGAKTYDVLPNGWAQSCVAADKPTGFIYVSSQAPYPAWTLNYRAPYIPFS